MQKITLAIVDDDGLQAQDIKDKNARIEAQKSATEQSYGRKLRELRYALTAGAGLRATGHTASDQIVVDAGGVPVRLNCSAHTNNVTYSMSA